MTKQTDNRMMVMTRERVCGVSIDGMEGEDPLYEMRDGERPRTFGFLFSTKIVITDTIKTRISMKTL